MENKYTGVLISKPRPADYIAGISSKIDIERDIKDWSIYLPKFERQHNNIKDFLICATMSGPDHSIATQLNYLLNTNKLSDEAVNFFYNEGYIVDGVFSLSSRFNATLNGTDKNKGNYLNVVADHVYFEGILSEQDWPTNNKMTWDEFYSDIPIKLLEKAKKVFWFIKIQYQWVRKEEIEDYLKIAPIQIATQVCPGWEENKPVPLCQGFPIQHATMLYGQDKVYNTKNWLILDQYTPFLKVLNSNYDLPLNMQYVVSVKPVALRNGMRGSNVLKLQKNLNKLGYSLKEDSILGQITESAIRNFQARNKLVVDGIAGPLTLKALENKTKPISLLDAVIEVESGGNDNAEGDKDLKNHAYGCLQIRQGVCDDVNKHFGTNHKAQDCLGNRDLSIDIWNKYWQIYPQLVNNEDRARAWNGGPGWKKIYFKAGKTDKEMKYCKNLDIYWSKVLKLLW